MRRERNVEQIANAAASQYKMLNVRPKPPRGVWFADGVVHWEHARELRNVTHYNVYADTDKHLSARVTVGQTEHVLIAERVFVSAFNDKSGLESPRVVANRDGELTPGGVPESVAETLPDLTGLTGRYEYTDLNDGRGLKLTLAVRGTLPSPIYGFLGLQSYYENPDRSDGANIFADGSTLADGSATSGGQWGATPGPRHAYAALEEFLIEGLDPVNKPTYMRVYLATYGSKSENPLVRANKPSPTPNVRILVNPPEDLPPGTQAAPLVTYFTVVQVSGRVVSYGVNGAGQRALFPAMAWVMPAGDYSGGVAFVIRSDGRHQRLTHGIWYGDDYRAEILDFPYEDEPVRFYLLSANLKGQVNVYAPGVTPYVDTILAAPLVDVPGKEYTSRVTSFDVGEGTYWPPNAEGQTGMAIYPYTIGIPNDPTFGAFAIFAVVPWQTEPIQVTGWESAQGIPLRIPYTPGTSMSVTLYALSRDVNQRANTYVPSGTWATPSETITLGPPPLGGAGSEFTDLVTLISGGASIQYRQTADGVEEWRLKLQWQPPSVETFGQMRYTIERTSGTPEYVESELAGDTGTVTYTKWRSFIVGEVYTAWFGSVSTNNRENSLVAGLTPRVTGLTPGLQTAGVLEGARIKTGSIVTAAAFAATIKPPEVVSSLPVLPDPNYPVGRLVFLTLDQKLYRSLAFTWTKAVDGADLVANSVIAGKIAAGSISTTELFAGEFLLGQGGGKPTRFKVVNSIGGAIGFWGDDSTVPFLGLWTSRLKVAPTLLTTSPRVEMNGSLLEIEGGTFHLLSSGVETSIDGLVEGVFGTVVGLRVRNTSTGVRCAIVPTGYHIQGSSGAASAASMTYQAGIFSTGGVLVLSSGAGSAVLTSVDSPSLSLSGSAVVGTRKTGWGSPTGPFIRGSFNTSTVTLAGIAQLLGALINDLHGSTGHGLIGV